MGINVSYVFDHSEVDIRPTDLGDSGPPSLHINDIALIPLDATALEEMVEQLETAAVRLRTWLDDNP